MTTETKNAKIDSTFLGIENHGIFTCFLHLDYDGGGQSFGNYDLRHHAYGIKFLTRILETLEVDSWEDLKGKLIRVNTEHTKVHGIGHILKDKWFYPERELIK